MKFCSLEDDLIKIFFSTRVAKIHRSIHKKYVMDAKYNNHFRLNHKDFGKNVFYDLYDTYHQIMHFIN